MQSEPAGAQVRSGDPRVDAVLDRLETLESLDLPARLDVFTDLQAALAQILDGPPPTT